MTPSRFAAQAGADVVGHDRALVIPTPGFGNMIEVYFPGWLVMVDRGGARRVDESTSYAVMQVAHRTWGPLFAIFDETAKKESQPGRSADLQAADPGHRLRRACRRTGPNR